MQPALRDAFNRNFSEEKYQQYLNAIDAIHPGALDFRVAETPIFIPKSFTKKMLQACEEIIDVLARKDFKQLTERAIPKEVFVPNETDHSDFIAFDFGICENENGTLEPQLIEMQGFPTLFAFQAFHTKYAKEYAQPPGNYDAYLNNYTEATYFELLKNIIVGNEQVENVILLEIFPEQQKTRIDFYCTEKVLGIKTVCITKLITEGKNIYYESEGKKIQVKRIYNRLIFDDLQQQKDLVDIIDFTKPWNVEWVSHPNWFNRISKFTLPFIEHPYVPETIFLSDLREIPTDLENYVLKPLFSFAGMGVVIDVTKEDIEKVKDPENWIIQRKVKYADIIKTPDEAAKAEIRLFYFWPKGASRPIAVHNLARLSKGKMIGTRYNKDKKWVGGTVAFFEK